jgi:hypothetical protein
LFKAWIDLVRLAKNGRLEHFIIYKYFLNGKPNQINRKKTSACIQAH